MDLDREKIVAAFLAESEEGLELMEQSLILVEAQPANMEPLNDVFRVAHTIKGNATALDFPELSGFAHVVEDVLDGVRSRQIAVSPDLVSLLLHAVDALRALVPTAAQGNDRLSPSHQELKARMSAYVASNTDGSAGLLPVPDMDSPKAVAGNQDPTPRNRTLRVAIDKLDCMLNLTGEITIAQGRLHRMIEELDSERGREILEMQREAERLHKELQEQVMGVRMVPVGPLFQQFTRSVRDISRSHNKLARLEVVGADVEVDTRVLENLKDPLLHMIRNAVDHGIELPNTRHALGKPPCGLLTLKAYQSGGNICIELSDDGQGFHRDKIIAKAKALGQLSDGERLSDEEVFGLVFTPGFSTAEAITDLSGRGVGMDVVRKNIDSLRGKIEIRSVDGQGTTIVIRLPLTLAIIDGFSVLAGDETYVIPLEMISECLELPPERISNHKGGIISLRGEPLPYIRLRDALGTPGAPPLRENVVVLAHEGGRAGLAVDRLLGESQAIIKPLSRLFHNVRGISGSTILGDGRVALILDVSTLMSDAIADYSETLQ